jgi:hypothetical protein
MALVRGCVEDSGWWIVDSRKAARAFSINHQLTTINFRPNFSAKRRMRPARHSVFGGVRLCLHFRFAEDEGFFV